VVDARHPRAASFRSRLRAGEQLLGTFLKSPAPVLVEVLAPTPIDVLCIDVEHAPFGPAELDACIVAARGADLPTLVRAAAATPEQIGRALDLGATGVIVPHVSSAAEARDVVRMSHFGPGGRSYAGTHRAGGFGSLTMREHLAVAAERTTVVVQLEDPEGIAAAADIAAVEGVDAVFIGPSDLTVAMGHDDTEHPEVLAAIAAGVAAARSVGGMVGALAGGPAALARLRSLGVTLLTAGSDQTFVQAGATALRAQLDALEA
jgi:2-keto-3-deoxy-L-rhamnonate aldolase RhmA